MATAKEWVQGLRQHSTCAPAHNMLHYDVAEYDKSIITRGILMDMQAINDLIRLAKQQESLDNNLFKLTLVRLEDLHHSIELSDENPEGALFQFAMDYIEHIPEFLSTLYNAQAACGIEEFIAPFLAIAEENLLSPCKEARLEALLGKTYFIYRLMEEANDAYQVKSGIGLIPLNMTWANLIAHTILGETVANTIDEVVQSTVKNRLTSQHVYDKKRFDEWVCYKDPQQWLVLWSYWPDLSLHSKAEVKFSSHTIC